MLQQLKKGVLVAVIVRDDQVIIPDGSTCIQERDSIIIVSKDHTILDVNDIYDTAAMSMGGDNEL